MIHHALKPSVLNWFQKHPGKYSFNHIWEALDRPPREHLRDTLRSFRKSKRLIQHGSREWEMSTTEKPNGKPNGVLDRAALFAAFKQLDGQATKTQLRKALHHDPSALLTEIEAEGLIIGQYGLYRVVNRAALGLVQPGPSAAAPKKGAAWKTDPWTINPFEPDSLRGQTVEALRVARPGSLTTAGVIQLVECPKGSVSANLYAVAKVGYGKRVGGGLWEATVPEDPIREGTVRSRVLCATTMGEDFSFEELMARLGGDLDLRQVHKQFFAGESLVRHIPELMHLGENRYHRKSEEDFRVEQVARETPRQDERKAIAAAAKPPEPPPPVPVERRPVDVSQLARIEPKPVKQPADPLAAIVADLRAQFTERERSAGELAHALSGLLQDLHRLDGAIRAMDPTHPPFVVAWGQALVTAVEEALKPRPPWAPPPQPPPYTPPWQAPPGTRKG